MRSEAASDQGWIEPPEDPVALLRDELAQPDSEPADTLSWVERCRATLRENAKR